MALTAICYLVAIIFFFYLGMSAGGLFGRYEQPGQELLGNIYGQIIFSFLLVTAFAWLLIILRRIRRWFRPAHDNSPHELPPTIGFAVFASITIFTAMTIYHWKVVIIDGTYVGEFGQTGTFWMKSIISLFKAGLIAHGIVFASVLSQTPLSITRNKGLFIFILGILGAYGGMFLYLDIATLFSPLFDVGLLITPFLVVYIYVRSRRKLT